MFVRLGGLGFRLYCFSACGAWHPRWSLTTQEWPFLAREADCSSASYGQERLIWATPGCPTHSRFSTERVRERKLVSRFQALAEALCGGWTRDSLTIALFRTKQLLLHRCSIVPNLCLHFRAQWLDEFCIVSTGRVIKCCRGVV